MGREMLDEILFELDDDLESIGSETTSIELIEGKPRFTVATAEDLRKAVSLAKEADKLIDFTGSSLNPLQQLYILGYASRGTKTGACRVSGATMGQVNRWLENAEFKAYLDMAVEAMRDALEEELLRRAMAGSDKLLLEALKAARPDKYNRKMADVNVNAHVVHSWADLAKAAASEIVAEDVAFEEVDE